MIWIPVVGLVLGVLIGLSFDLTVSVQYSSYLSIAILAALDTVFGGIRASLEKHFDSGVFISGFFFNTLLAALLAFIGVQLGVDLYLAAVFAFGVRLFNNIATIRRLIVTRNRTRNTSN
ncbi:MAG: small basic family protein [Tumebacillaceae bacterium]